MNIDECAKKDGNYFLIELLDYQAEFELVVKDGAQFLFENNYGKLTPLDEKNMTLKCRLYESDNWKSEGTD